MLVRSPEAAPITVPVTVLSDLYLCAGLCKSYAALGVCVQRHHPWVTVDRGT